jgi:carbon monoxide dehydrogenase subunit G
LFSESFTISITQPREVVFQYINNLDNIPAWQGGIEKVSYSQNPPGLGTLFHIERSVLGRHISTTMKIIELTDNQGYVAQSSRGPVMFTVHISLEDEDEKTKVSTSVKGETKGMARFAETLIAAQISISLREDGERLKLQLENKK